MSLVPFCLSIIALLGEHFGFLTSSAFNAAVL